LLKLSGEGGYSFYKNVISTDSSAINNDFFYTTALHYKYKPANIQFYGGYKEVGPHFSSPAAQTLRINISQGPNLFPDVLNNQAQRGQLLYDRFTDPTIYNQTIMPVLMPYLPQYGNVLPYGDATPNRVGWNLGIGLGDKTKFINLTGRADVLKEVIGEGTPSLRKFILVRGGASFQINKLLQSERIFTLSVGTKIENTQRQAPASVSLTSTQLDVGLTIETIKNLDLMGGYKSLSANGNEYTAIRNSLNEISGFTPVNLNFRQDIVSAGIRYRFTTRSFFTVNGNYSFNNMYSNSNIGYRINEYFVNYTLIF